MPRSLLEEATPTSNYSGTVFRLYLIGLSAFFHLLEGTGSSRSRRWLHLASGGPGIVYGTRRSGGAVVVRYSSSYGIMLGACLGI